MAIAEWNLLAILAFLQKQYRGGQWQFRNRAQEGDTWKPAAQGQQRLKLNSPFCSCKEKPATVKQVMCFGEWLQTRVRQKSSRVLAKLHWHYQQIQHTVVPTVIETFHGCISVCTYLESVECYKPAVIHVMRNTLYVWMPNFSWITAVDFNSFYHTACSFRSRRIRNNLLLMHQWIISVFKINIWFRVFRLINSNHFYCGLLVCSCAHEQCIMLYIRC